MVTLEPGDVLFVPKHWWHFVEAVDTSLNVNVWVDAPDDAHDRAKEAIARVLVTSLAGGLDAEVGVWVSGVRMACFFFMPDSQIACVSTLWNVGHTYAQ